MSVVKQLGENIADSSTFFKAQHVLIEICVCILFFLFQDANVESTIVVLHQDTFATAIQMTVYGDLMKVTLPINKDCH